MSRLLGTWSPGSAVAVTTVTDLQGQRSGAGVLYGLESWVGPSLSLSFPFCGMRVATAQPSLQDYTCLLGAWLSSLYKAKVTSHTQGQGQDSRRQTAQCLLPRGRLCGLRAPEF